jgi:signal transduction histidine kinase
MHERASSCGGRLAVDSGDNGTAVELVVPIGVMANG